jgi:hypothetical protein
MFSCHVASELWYFGIRDPSFSPPPKKGNDNICAGQHDITLTSHLPAGTWHNNNVETTLKQCHDLASRRIRFVIMSCICWAQFSTGTLWVSDNEKINEKLHTTIRGSGWGRWKVVHKKKFCCVFTIDPIIPTVLHYLNNYIFLWNAFSV